MTGGNMNTSFSSCHTARLTSRLRFSCRAMLLLLVSTAALHTHAATYYRWVDEQGTTHFTNTPPKGRVAEKVSTGSGATAAPPAQQNETPTLSAAETEQQAANFKDPERCAIAQERVKTLESGQRIRMQTEDGGYYYLSPEQIQEELVKSKEAISESC